MKKIGLFIQKNVFFLSLIFAIFSIAATGYFSNLAVKVMTINFMTITNLQVGGIDLVTNQFSGNALILGQESSISTASDVDLNSITNLSVNTYRWGQLDIFASGANINVTNPPSSAGWYTSDHSNTRVVTNGNWLVIGFEVQPGVFTNLFFGQSGGN